jgi:hypothetical protein
MDRDLDAFPRMDRYVPARLLGEGGDLDAAARLLRVSPAALKKRLTLLSLKARG